MRVHVRMLHGEEVKCDELETQHHHEPVQRLLMTTPSVHYN